MEWEELVMRLNGKTKPASFQIIFAISEFGNIILDCDNPEVFNDTHYLGDWMEDKEIPKVKGVYSATITIHSYRSNNIDDPEEWDMTINYADIKQIIPLNLCD